MFEENLLSGAQPQSSDFFESLFNPTFVKEETKQTQIPEFMPSADKGKGGVYNAVIRFVPWHLDPSNSIIKKSHYWLVDPTSANNSGRYVDCPASVGKPSKISDLFWKLRNSDNAFEKSLSEKFKRKQFFAALVQVVKDENAPENVGKIMIWRFGFKVNEKIDAELYPQIGEPHQPFNMMTGKLFSIQVKKVSGFNNYDACAFLHNTAPIPLMIKETPESKYTPITEQTDRSLVLQYLKDNSPDLNKYAYQPWDSETEEYVDKVINATCNQGTYNSTIGDIHNNSMVTSSDMLIGNAAGVSDMLINDINTTENTDNTSGSMGDIEDLLATL